MKWDFRALELHGRAMWDHNKIEQAFRFIEDHHMNALVLHESDLTGADMVRVHRTEVLGAVRRFPADRRNHYKPRLTGRQGVPGAEEMPVPSLREKRSCRMVRLDHRKHAQASVKSRYEACGPRLLVQKV